MSELGRVEFSVEGSTGTPYDVTFVLREDSNLSAYCTCPAGQNGMYCKHRFAILSGDGRAITSGKPEHIVLVQEWLAGSDVEAAMQRVVELEKEAAKAKRAVSAAKKDLAAAMRD